MLRRKHNRFVCRMLAVAVAATSIFASSPVTQAQTVEVSTEASQVAAEDQIILHVKGTGLSIHYWKGSTGTKWPGDPMQEDSVMGSGWSYAAIDAGCDGFIIVGSGENKLTEDVTGKSAGEYWFVDGKFYDSNPEGPKTPEPPATPTPKPTPGPLNIANVSPADGESLKAGEEQIITVDASSTIGDKVVYYKYEVKCDGKYVGDHYYSKSNTYSFTPEDGKDYTVTVSVQAHDMDNTTITNELKYTGSDDGIIATPCSSRDPQNSKEPEPIASEPTETEPATPESEAPVTSDQPSIEPGETVVPPVATKAPDETKEPEASKAPDATKAPEATKAPDAPDVTDTPREPDKTKAPEETKAPATSKAPEATKAPEASKAPDGTTKPSETSKPTQNNTPEPAKTTEPTKAPASTSTPTTSNTANPNNTVAPSTTTKPSDTGFDPFSGVTVKGTGSGASTQKLGASIKLSAEATDGEGAYQYMFFYKKSESSDDETVIRKYSTSNSCTWKPTKTGTYYVYVRAIDATNRDSEVLIKKYVIKGLSATVKTSKKSPQKRNKKIVLVATPKNATGSVKYRFVVKLKNKTVKDSKYQSSGRYNWKPTKKGTYTIYVYVKDSYKSVTMKRSFKIK